MLFDAIFLGLFLAGWLLCAYIPWVAYSIATRGHAGMWMLPICLFAGVVFALAVPSFGFDGKGGLAFSFLAAFLGSALLLAARRFAVAPPEHPTEAAPPPEADSTHHA